MATSKRKSRSFVVPDEDIPAAPCPFCGGLETELYSLFGSQLSTSQHYCTTCRVVFEQFKWRGESTSEG